MLLVYVILLSALAGCFLTLLLQLLLLYRREPEPPATGFPGTIYTRVAPDSTLREYLQGSEPAGSQAAPEPVPGAAPASAPAAAAPAAAPGPEPSAKQPPPQQPPEPPADPCPREETCQFLNAIFLFLFRELRDTALVRDWVTKKIKVEFEELLQTKVAGKVLEGLSLRDVCLGNVLPVFKSVKLIRPVLCNEEGCPEELGFEVDVEYNGGFHLAIDADLVFGKSAYLFVKISRVMGRLKLVFTRRPFTHWSFSFMDDPLILIEAKSLFEGRTVHQLNSIIVNQFRKVIKRKHTLPNYKIRFKPFFPFQVLPPDEYEDRDLCIQDILLAEGRLKVTLIECTRLLIFGSYEREANVHCTMELSSNVWEEKSRSSIKTAELVKGNLQSVGLTLRLVQPKEDDAGHVVIETVTPNSPAAAADLQRGDRLLAIGSVKITSTVQVLKLIRQAGDRVVVFYERPVGYNQHGSALQDGFGQLEDSAFLTQPEDDQAGLSADVDNRDFDSEFEELASESPEQKEELPTIPSPKRSAVMLAAKPLGTISPILNRKIPLGSYQTTSKTQEKDAAKVSTPKTSESSDASQQSGKQSQGSSTKPPVPPRPQSKTILPTSETPNLGETAGVSSEKPERPPPPTNNGDKCTEKVVKNNDQTEDPTVSKVITAPKQDNLKDGLSENARSYKDGGDDHHTWESPEIPYKVLQGRWPRTRTSSCLFEVEGHHKYLNVALWCRDPLKVGCFICLGYASIKLEEIAFDCIATSSMEYTRTFKLAAPRPKAAVTRTALRNLTTLKGFDEKFRYGDVTLHFKCLKEGEADDSSFLLEKENECPLEEEARAVQKEDSYLGPVVLPENKHKFQDTHFQNPTWCDYCKKKVWTKAASQCMLCAYVCHKKCQEKCLAETPFCVEAEKRLDRTVGSGVEGQAAPQAASSRVDSESKSVNRTAGFTRQFFNTSTRFLNLRQVPKARLSDPGTEVVEPSPKHTPNTSDNESSDTEISGPSSPSKRATGTGIKLVRKEGGLDDSVFIAVKEIGRDLYRSLPTEERFQKLEFMLDKLQNEIDHELENNNLLVKEEREATDARKKALISAALAKSGERLQALTLLMIHYRAGIEDIESLENLSVERQAKRVTKDSEEPNVAEEMESEDVSLTEAPTINIVSEEAVDPPQSVD
ncbi:PDZ domain-containing protein 8 isoform B [Patagioenas fasciata monilis]|uniref:PDZ domain-containing protein 8 isoform B n=2 Tax=Patagioenas fasciata monilis TaxID=372326 RepID=A0A1V4KK09_PATFA|nr:PDZ domain-containing protein 8 isoform B [Patagioenas fasciata monilis]